MLIQMPIIMGLFALLRNPMQYITDDSMIFAFHESFAWIRRPESAGSMDPANHSRRCNIYFVFHDAGFIDGGTDANNQMAGMHENDEIHFPDHDFVDG